MSMIRRWRKDPIYLTDLSGCLPAVAVTRGHRGKGAWKVFDYETESLRGSLLHATMLSGAPDVTLPVEHQGWHAVYVGLYGGEHGFHKKEATMSELLRVRLSGDSGFAEMTRQSPNRDSIEEVFWRCADLTGQDIVFGQRTKGVLFPAGVAYVKLVPLDADEVKQIQADRDCPANRKLIGQVDNYGIYGANSPRSVEELLAHMDVYKDTDLFRLLWSVGGATPGRSNLPETFRLRDNYPGQGYKNIAETLEYFIHEKGIDPLRVFIDRARQLGLEIYISSRLAITGDRIPFDGFHSSPYWHEHPEWACKLPDGRKVFRLSMAYAGARKCLVDFYRKLATYGPDGVSLTFTRWGPYCLYEDPVIEDFKKIHGVDPRDLTPRDPDSFVGDGSSPHGPQIVSEKRLWDALHLEDPRVTRHRCGYVTELMREMRSAMDDEARKLGRDRMPICVTVYGEPKYDLPVGLDVEEWIRQGLIDCIVGFPPAYVSAAEAGGIEASAAISGPRHKPADEYIRMAKDAYACGARGLAFWDIDSRHPVKAQWNTVSRLGHVAELDILAETPQAKITYHRLLTINGICPDEGFA